MWGSFLCFVAHDPIRHPLNNLSPARNRPQLLLKWGKNFCPSQILLGLSFLAANLCYRNLPNCLLPSSNPPQPNYTKSTDTQFPSVKQHFLPFLFLLELWVYPALWSNSQHNIVIVLLRGSVPNLKYKPF